MLYPAIAFADYNVTASATCKSVDVLTHKDGKHFIFKEEECTTTPSDWKDE